MVRKSYVAVPVAAAFALAVALLGSALGNGGENRTVAGATATAPEGAAAPTPDFPDSAKAAMTAGVSQYAPGVPAIPVTAPVGVNMPTFSVADVVAYLNEYPPLHWDPETPLPTVEGIKFLTASDTEMRLQTTLYRPKNELVGLVTLKGSFVVSGPSIPGRDGPAFVSSVEYLVFSAQTGNLLQIITPQ